MNSISPSSAASPFLRNSCTLAVACLSLIACSSDSDDASASRLYDGQWERSCQTYNNGANSFTDVVTINGGTSNRTRKAYADSDCQQAISSSSYDVTISYGESVTMPDSGLTAQQIDLSVGEINFTPLTEPTATNWNELQQCGLDTYQVDMPTVVPIDCDLLNLGTGELYSLWAIDGDVLYFGSDPADALTPDDRPTSLDIDNPFRRQSN